MAAGPPAVPPGAAAGLHPSSYACDLVCSVKLRMHVHKQQQSRCHHKRHTGGHGTTICLVPLGWILRLETSPRTASRCFRRPHRPRAVPNFMDHRMIPTHLCALDRSICHDNFKSPTANKRGALAARHSLQTERKLWGFLFLSGSVERVSPWGHPEQQSAGKETVLLLRPGVG